MKTKITPQNFKINMIKGFLVVVMLLCFSENILSQTITNVFPKRVTTGSVVTVVGTDFTPSTVVTISGVATGGVQYVSSTEIRFPITRHSGGSKTGYINLNDVKYLDPIQITYVAPKEESLITSKTFLVKEIYTNWDYNGTGFWRSTNYTEATKEASAPNNKHQLLGYMVNNGIDDVIYSTGVEDSVLETNLLASGDLFPADIAAAAAPEPISGLKYYRKVFKAYSTNGVRGKLKSDNFIIAGDMIDNIEHDDETNEPEEFETITEIKNLSILEAITNGKNGLELGIGVTNFSSQNDIQFFSGNGKPGAVDDYDAPDLLITQIADAQGYEDVYYYADNLGNVIGRPIKLKIEDLLNTELAKWKVNLYKFPLGRDFAATNPDGRATIYIEDPFRPIRMAAFELKDFDITTPTQVAEINNINMNAGGQADIAFMAYNAASFDIKGPVAKTILPRYVCRVDNNSSATFKVQIGKVPEGGNVGIEDFTVMPDHIRGEIPSDGPVLWQYELSKDGVVVNAQSPNPASLTVNNINAGKIGVYKLLIDNGQGSIVVPVELAEGGVPTIWNGTTWSSLPYTDVAVADRNLFFATDYNQTVNLLEGCDCYVANEVEVVIAKGKVMKLYGKIVVEEEVEKDEDNDIPGVAAGTFTLENNASLVQINEPTDIIYNKGVITAKRDAEELIKYDYVYWSSPVNAGELKMIPGATQHVYKWDVNEVASNQTIGTKGNWVKEPTGIMENARGYIKRVNVESTIHAAFNGTPNNGLININVYKTDLSSGGVMSSEAMHNNLLGNPYPSAISAQTFLEKNLNLEGYVKVWSYRLGEPILGGDDPFYGDFKYNYGDQYLTYNKLGTVPEIENNFDGKIASGQGFFVKVMNSQADVSNVFFNNSMRYDSANPNGYDNSDFKRGVVSNGNKALDEKQLIWLSLVNEKNISSVTLLGYAEGATNGKDRLYDANSGSGAMRIYSVLEDSDLIIQGRALPFEESDQVPLGIEILKNGIYKIGIDHLKGSVMLNEDQGIYLEDTYTNAIHDLRVAPYGFTATEGDIKDRFVLRYTNTTLSVDDNQMSETFVYVKNEQLYVKASKHIEAVEVYDLTGKKLVDYKLDGYEDSFNTQFQFPKSVYLTVIKLKDMGSITKKVIN